MSSVEELEAEMSRLEKKYYMEMGGNINRDIANYDKIRRVAEMIFDAVLFEDDDE